VAIGLLIIGFGKPTWRNLLIAGVITGIGVSSMHYTGMLAMQMQATMSYRPILFVASVLIGIVAATAALWAALRLRGLWSTLGASLIMGVAVSGMHYTGMAAMTMSRAPAGVTMPMTGATAEGFLLPLIIGISVVSIIMTGVLLFSPTEDEIREDADLMARINAATSRLAAAPPLPTTPAARWPGPGRPGHDGRSPDTDRRLTARAKDSERQTPASPQTAADAQPPTDTPARAGVRGRAGVRPRTTSR
jgi:Bacterial signalling protein N terminal repeat